MTWCCPGTFGEDSTVINEFGERLGTYVRDALCEGGPWLLNFQLREDAAARGEELEEIIM